MKESNFFHLLGTLTERELTAFYHFANGIYFKQQVQLRLLAYIYQERPKKQGVDKRTIEAAYRVAFNSELENEWHRKKLFNTLSDLNNWLIDFLVLKEVQKDTVVRELLAAKVYKDRHLRKLFYRTLRKIKKELQTTVKDDFWKPLKAMIYAHFSYFYATTEKHSLKSVDLQNAMEYLDQFYFLGKLRYGMELISRQRLLSVRTDIIFLEDVKAEVKKTVYQQQPIFQLYYWLLKLREEQSLEAYYRLKKSFYTFNFEDRIEHLIVMRSLINFVSSHTRSGRTDLDEDALGLYKEGIKHDLLVQDGIITMISFLNVVNTACSHKEFSWAATFIEEHGKFLLPTLKSDLIALCYARIHTNQEAFSKALSFLATISSKNFYIEILRRFYQLQCFVELKEDEELIYSRCINFLAYLDRHKTKNAQVAKGYMNFVKLLQKIVRKVPVENMERFLEENDSIVARSWLVKNITALQYFKK